jgi:hypothetical protein
LNFWNVTAHFTTPAAEEFLMTALLTSAKLWVPVMFL